MFFYRESMNATGPAISNKDACTARGSFTLWTIDRFNGRLEPDVIILVYVVVDEPGTEEAALGLNPGPDDGHGHDFPDRIAVCLGRTQQSVFPVFFRQLKPLGCCPKPSLGMGT